MATIGTLTPMTTPRALNDAVQGKKRSREDDSTNRNAPKVTKSDARDVAGFQSKDTMSSCDDMQVEESLR